MARQIYTADEVRRLVAHGAQLVEVLPKPEFDEQHLPGAIHIPLREIDAETKQRLDPTAAVIVYCWDTACDMSPRAAARLEEIGFSDVHDYVPGKLDWIARGLPFEGSLAGKPMAGEVARKDVATCRPDERVRDVKRRVQDICVVVDRNQVVLGMLRQAELEPPDNVTAADAMITGPSTFRPHVPIDEMAQYMAENDLNDAPITSLDGTLIGVLFRQDADHG